MVTDCNQGFGNKLQRLCFLLPTTRRLQPLACCFPYKPSPAQKPPSHPPVLLLSCSCIWAAVPCVSVFFLASLTTTSLSHLQSFTQWNGMTTFLMTLEICGAEAQQATETIFVITINLLLFFCVGFVRNNELSFKPQWTQPRNQFKLHTLVNKKIKWQRKELWSRYR